MSALTSKNKSLTRRINEEMWNEGNPALAAEIFSRPAGVERFVRRFLFAFPDLQHTIETMIEEGDQVAVRFSAHGTHSGPWMDIPPTARSIRYTGMTLARIQDGKVIDHYTWWDKAGVIEQLRD